MLALASGAPIRDAAGNLAGPGAAATAELLAGTSPSVAPFSTPITTSTWVGNGWFNVGAPAVVLAGFAPGSHPFFQVAVLGQLRRNKQLCGGISGRQGCRNNAYLAAPGRRRVEWIRKSIRRTPAYCLEPFRITWNALHAT